jgi:glucosamine kinase
LASFFKFAKISVDHDIAAAAIACCRNNPGIVSICASGSNAAWYDGKKVKPNNYGLGYILADEGSGNWLGKQLIKSYMSEKLPVTCGKSLHTAMMPTVKLYWRKYIVKNSLRCS